MNAQERDDLRLDINDRRSLLEALSLDLIKDSIDNQINYSLPSTTDFLSTVLSKFNYILSMEDIDDEDKAEVKFQIIDFCEDLIVDISNKFNIFIDHTNNDYESSIKLLSTLYNFLVLNRSNNVERFLINYIHKNKHELVETLGLSPDKKDIISFAANKQDEIDKDSVCMLASMTQVINFITSTNIIEPTEFLETINDGEYYTNNMIDYYSDCTISGSFIGVLFNDVLDDDYDSNELTRIRNNIRISFYQ